MSLIKGEIDAIPCMRVSHLSGDATEDHRRLLNIRTRIMPVMRRFVDKIQAATAEYGELLTLVEKR